MKRATLSVLLILLFVIPLAGCEKLGMVPFSQLTPKAKLSYMYSVYNSQYTDYMKQTGYAKQPDGAWVKVATPDIPEAKRAILRTRKGILTNVYPLIQLYDSQMQFGSAPSADTEQKILDLLNQLE